MKVSAIQRSNKNAVITYGVMNLILVICYLLEVLKGSRTIVYYAIFCALALFPFLVCFICYRKNKETKLVQPIMEAGFLIFYIFIIFTTISPVAYIYAFIIAIGLMTFDNKKATTAYLVAVIVANIAHVAYLGVSGQLLSEDLPTIEIQVASTILFAVYLIMSLNVLMKNNADRMALVKEQEQKTGELMKKVLAAASEITNGINDVTDKMESLQNCASQTMDAMEEVSNGTLDTAESIQNQLEKTEEISMTIGEVDAASTAISENVMATREELDKTKVNVDLLINNTEESNRFTENVSKELLELTEYAEQMQSIIDVIGNITDQTSLLSLNASIEAARAGEAGRGFAVVAGEISALATQTQTATEDITQLINNISSELADVVKVIEDMIALTKSQNEAALATADSFKTINTMNEGVYENSKVLANMMKDLTVANAAISHNIETISAATEEVTAQSNVTLDISNQNSQVTGEVGNIIDRLYEEANELMRITQ